VILAYQEMGINWLHIPRLQIRGFPDATRLRPLKTVLTKATYFKGTFMNSGYWTGVYDSDRPLQFSPLFSIKWLRTK